MNAVVQRRKLSGLVAAALLSAASSPLVLAGDWHRRETLICSDCHTIHNSAEGQPLRYDGIAEPARLLLRAEDATQLCISCHDGSRPDAPDVIAPTVNPAVPAGGWFASNPVGALNPAGHDLLSSAPQTPPGGVDAMVLSCLSCHSPHGSDSYRNLLETPPGSFNTEPVVVVVEPLGGTGGSAGAGGGGARVPPVPYAAGEQRYRSGTARWCNDCHGEFHGRSGSEEGASEPWLRHPQDARLQGAHGVDFPHWSGELENRVPVESPNDPDVPSADDRVFCLTCHRAHGSDRPSALIWADGSTKLSTCQQCHNR